MEDIILKRKVDNLLFSLNINCISMHSNIYLNINTDKFKNKFKNTLKLYNKFKFDTLVFKIVENYADELQNPNYIINILNKFLDITKLKKPTHIRKVKLKDNTKEVYFYWDLTKQKINIDELSKEILLIEKNPTENLSVFNGFVELLGCVFFLDTKQDILFNIYSTNGIKILSSNILVLKKIFRKYKKYLFEEDLSIISNLFEN